MNEIIVMLIANTLTASTYKYLTEHTESHK